MTKMIGHPEHQNKQDEKSDKPPFDVSELGNIPPANGDDPPYRDWWVIDVDGGEPPAE